MKKMVNPGWEHVKRYTFAPAVQEGDMIFISGTTAADENGKLVGEGDIVAQTEYIFQKFESILAAVGGALEHITMTKDYIVSTENYKKTAEVRKRIFKGNYPAATGVIVAGLLRPGALIEIEAIAVLPKGDVRHGA